MSIKKLSDLPNINQVRVDGNGDPLPIAQRVANSDLLSISITGTPNNSFNGGSFSPSGWASVKIEIDDFIDKIEISLDIPGIESNIAALAAISSYTLQIPSITGNINTLGAVSSNIATNAANITSLSSQVSSNTDLLETISGQVSGYLNSEGIFVEYNAEGYAAAVSAAQSWNAIAGDGWLSSGIALQTGEFLKLEFGNPPSARYLPLYIFSVDHPSGG